MKKIFYFLLLSSWTQCEGQTIVPVIKAGFGIEGDLRANYYTSATQLVNDDWFNDGTPGQGTFVIDTSGAASLVSNYIGSATARQTPFYRTMNYPAFSIVNNKLLLDAVFIRDFHGNDSTVFANGASKNGESPANWNCPAAQSVPDKNEILDMMAHLRRDGTAYNDSLWLLGGLSIENTTGDRYFDFEMYQTDLVYNKSTQTFSGYGPDAGHTSWLFNAAGNVIRAGDIIFSAEYGSSSLTTIDALIWIDKASLNINPVNFNWSGLFNGATNGAQYGYASISPKTAGNFYTGVENTNSTWAGPFSLIRADNSLVTNYIPGQFMEFSVNLTKLGLDPVAQFGGNICNLPFKRVLVKSRASTSFTSALKDFIAPFSFFVTPKASIVADQSTLCGMVGVSRIQVTNPVSTSVYTWSTTNGRIVGSTTGTSINVDSVGTYIVTQQLQPGCSIYASDTIKILSNPFCFVLEKDLLEFSGSLSGRQIRLAWSVSENTVVKSFEIEKSTDGVTFVPSGLLVHLPADIPSRKYTALDQSVEVLPGPVYYRLKIIDKENRISYSKTLAFSHEQIKSTVTIAPNPVRDVMKLIVTSPAETELQVFIYHATGRL
ncbi:MAG: hypothetical protein ABIN25_06945, partial [Ginsengibacter sp.]